jgi:hypothetical protein
VLKVEDGAWELRFMVDGSKAQVTTWSLQLTYEVEAVLWE